MRSTPIPPHGANAVGSLGTKYRREPPTGGVCQRHFPPDALPQRAVVATRRHQIERPTTRLVSSVVSTKTYAAKLLGLPLGDARLEMEMAYLTTAANGSTSPVPATTM